MARTWSAVLARTGVRTGDGRILMEGAGSSRDLPLPLMYQRETGDGHDGAVIVGRIESMRFENGMVTATGSMLEDGEWIAIAAMEAGVIGPSVDLDDIEYMMDADESIVLTSWRVAGATLVAVPAFADVSITLDPAPAEPLQQAAETGFEDQGIYGEPLPRTDPIYSPEYAAELAAFAVATQERLSATETLPPLDWFARSDVDALTPLTVTQDGRVFGHIAPWGACHVGLPGCVTAPASLTGYSHFHVGEQRVQGGGSVPVGALVTGPRHADPQSAFRAAQQHYDDLDATVARVSAGEDEFGIWVAGWILPTAVPARVEQFMASPVSGDWRRVGGSLEMIAVCSVNAPGFPVPRARVSFSNGEQRSLIGSFGVTAQRGEIPVAAPRSAPEGWIAAHARWAASEWNRKVA